MSDSNPTPEEALAEYRDRRDFTRTPEPSGHERSPADGRLVFVVQKHDASTLHYDFRLEMAGVLKSWAVPKGPSLDPADKRLAVMTEDHPLDYATFEGTIPEGEYGGGTVMLWDHGWWEPDLAWIAAGKKGKKKASAAETAAPAEATAGAEAAASAAAETASSPDGPAEYDVEAALAAGELKIVLHGEKLSGSWVLVHMKGRGARNWLLIKHRDDSAERGSSIVDEEPDSILTGRTLEEIAEG